MQDTFLPINETLCTSNSEVCKICNGNSCNTKNEFQKCYSCSSEIDPQCSKNPQLTSSKICDDYDSICMVGIDEDGNTHRQCKNKESHTTGVDFRKDFTCEANNCNVDIFPKDRMKCYQCVGNECSNALYSAEEVEDSLKPEACSMFSKNDQCFTYIDQGKIS